MDILEEILNGIKHAERLIPIKHRKGPHWKHRKSRMLLAASEASLAMYVEDEDNSGACKGSLEDLICLEEPTSTNRGNKTLDDLLGMQQLSISKNSTERTSSDSDTPSGQ